MTHGPEYDDNLSRSEVFKLGSILESLREIFKILIPKSHSYQLNHFISVGEGWLGQESEGRELRAGWEPGWAS